MGEITPLNKEYLNVHRPYEEVRLDYNKVREIIARYVEEHTSGNRKAWIASISFDQYGVTVPLKHAEGG